LVVDPKFIENWNKIQSRKGSSKRRRYIALGIIGAIIVAIVFVVLFFRTDLIVKPIEALTVKPSPGDWAMYGRDLTHSGVAVLSDKLPQGKVSKLFTSEGAMHSSPVIANGIIYVGSRDHNLYAFDAASGNKIWQFTTGSWVESSAAVVDNVVYFGSNDGNIYALDAKTGRKLWSYNVKDTIESSAAVVDGKVYFGCDDYSIYCLDAKTGKRLWSKTTLGYVSSSPAISNGLLYAGSSDGQFYALDARTGRQRLAFDAKKVVSSSPVVTDGSTVIFIANNGTIFALNGQARNWFGESVLRPPWQILGMYGDVPAPPPPSGYQWSISFKGVNTISSPTLSGGKIYTGLGTQVVCVDLQTHQQVWLTPMKIAINFAGVLAADTVFATGADGHLYLLNAQSGEILKDIAVGGVISSDPLMVDGRVYISSEDGCLYLVE